MTSRTMKCTFAQLKLGKGAGPHENLKLVECDKRTAKTMSGDVGISASEGLKELLNLEAFQNPTGSHPVPCKFQEH